MPVLLYVIYPCVLWSVWYESLTGHGFAVANPDEMTVAATAEERSAIRSAT